MRILWVSKASVTASYRKKLALLAHTGAEVGVITGDEWGAWKFESADEDAGYTILRRRQRLSGRNHFHWYPGMNRLIDSFHPDILHIDEEHYSVVTYQAARLAVRRDIPFVFQTWQNIYKGYPFPFSAMEAYVFRHAAAGLAGTAEVKDVLTRQGFHRDIYIVPLGVDTEVFYPDTSTAWRKRFGINGRRAVGFVGRLVPEKGVMDLAEALVPLLEGHPDWLWVVAGSGPLEAVLKNRIGAVADQVRFISWLGTDDMAHLMNALDVLVVPSRTTAQWKEQFGRVLIEAMACKVPVIAYASGEIPQVVQDAGLLVDEGDTDTLRQQIARLMQSNQIRGDLSERGYQRATRMFTQAQVASQLMDVYRTVIQ